MKQLYMGLAWLLVAAQSACVCAVDGVMEPTDAAIGDTWTFADAPRADMRQVDGALDGGSAGDGLLPDALPDSSSTDGLSQDALALDALALDTLAPDTLAPDTLAPDTLAQDTLASDTLAPDTLAPDTLAPDTLAPDTLAPDTLAPDTLAPDTLAPDTLTPDTSVSVDADFDAGYPDLSFDAALITVELDLMVLYTPAVISNQGGVEQAGDLVVALVALLNDAFGNSDIDVAVRLVHHGEVEYQEHSTVTDLFRLESPHDAFLNDVHTWRDQWAADMVVLLVHYDNLAGESHVGSPFSVVSDVFAQSIFSFPHEVGHMLGCKHDRQNSGNTLPGTYNYGHRFVGDNSQQYRTIMAYAPGQRILYYANPEVFYRGTATGIPEGTLGPSDEELAADCARKIREFAPIMAGMRTP